MTGGLQMLLWLRGCLQEVNQFKQKFSAWFAANSVLQGASLQYINSQFSGCRFAKVSAATVQVQVAVL